MNDHWGKRAFCFHVVEHAPRWLYIVALPGPNYTMCELILNRAQSTVLWFIFGSKLD